VKTGIWRKKMREIAKEKGRKGKYQKNGRLKG
jgi:hypothetical protein